VLKAIDRTTGQVEVVRVLKGRYAVGQKVEMYVYQADERVGELRVLLDPEAVLGPRFRDLSLSFEDEIRWLVGRPRVDTVALALVLARGYSDAARDEAITFFKERKTFPAKEILVALKALRKASPERTYEIGCLVDVLLLKESEVGFAFVRKEVAAWVEGKGKAIDWKKLPADESDRGAWLTVLVGACGERWSPMYFHGGRKRTPAHAKLRAELKGLLLDALPDLDLASMADATYALAWTKTATLTEIAAAFPKEEGRDGFALGLYWTGRTQKSWWRKREARISYETALGVTKRPELIAAIRDALPKKN
jgi:hypothetical protein